MDRLLQGDSEKQVANRLGISRHTVHVYVKGLYERFGVCSRGELMALWLAAVRAELRKVRERVERLERMLPG